MTLKLKFCFLTTIFLISLKLHSQQEIKYAAYSKCDTLKSKITKERIGNLRCFNVNNDCVLFFTNKESLLEYLQKNKPPVTLARNYRKRKLILKNTMSFYSGQEMEWASMNPTGSRKKTDILL